MKYLKQSKGSFVLPQLVDTYEVELYSIVNLLNFGKYDVIMDVGAIEGYYAVGFSLIFKTFYCIWSHFTEKKVNWKLADLNGVQDKIQIEGFCESYLLYNYLNMFSTTYILMCIEGGEKYYLIQTYLRN